MRQDKNLQLIGNVNFLFNSSEGEYVWIIGDDDLLNEGAVKSLFAEVQSSRKPFYLLNFQREIEGILEHNYWPSVSGDYESLYKDGMTGGFGFISVCVFQKKEFLPTFINNDTPDNMLMYPMARSFYGLFILHGKALLDRPYVTHHAGGYSWFSKYVEVQSIYSYKALLLLEPLVTLEQYKHLLDLRFRTTIFKNNSFFYLLKSKDKWYLDELRKHGVLSAVISTGLFYLMKRIGHKLFCALHIKK